MSFIYYYLFFNYVFLIYNLQAFIYSSTFSRMGCLAVMIILLSLLTPLTQSYKLLQTPIECGASSLNFSLFCCILCGAGCHCFWPGRINTCLLCCRLLLGAAHFYVKFQSPEFIVFVYKVFACTIVRCPKLMASEGGRSLPLPLFLLSIWLRGLSENNVMEIMRKRKVHVSFKRGLVCNYDNYCILFALKLHETLKSQHFARLRSCIISRLMKS